MYYVMMALYLAILLASMAGLLNFWLAVVLMVVSMTAVVVLENWLSALTRHRKETL